MKICVLAEGSYPYVTGGVSSWLQTLINSMPEYEFEIYAIGAEKKLKGNYKYDIPHNANMSTEVFLDEFSSERGRPKKELAVDSGCFDAFVSLIAGDDVRWGKFFQLMVMLRNENIKSFFMSRTFFDAVVEAYERAYDRLPFNDFFWSVRSMLLPLFYVLKNPPPEADIYHSVAAGYAGVAASYGKYLYGKPFILSEHGIYSREREEEIIRSNWVKGCLKDMWIGFFHNLSKCAYEFSDEVVSLFEKNKELEVEIGCPKEKISIIPNGVNTMEYADVPRKDEKDASINIGAIVRIVPIKDIKTMIQSFSIVKEQVSSAVFYIMGPTEEDEEYYEECVQHVKSLDVKDVIFTGRVNIKEYVGKMDMIVLSSISEGLPLAILEGMACRKAMVSTDVGACREVLHGGQGDEYGRAGIVVPVMNYELMAEAIIELSLNEPLRKKMGENGFKRVENVYPKERCTESYRNLYKKLSERQNGSGGDSYGRNWF